jgi:Family of unknown function (DUF5675)
MKTKILSLGVIVLGLFAWYITPYSNSSSFQITIERLSPTDKCYMGYLSLSNTIKCYTLELPYKGNQNYISSIPLGKYSAFIRKDGKMGWRIELVDTGDRKHIQIHSGNSPSDIEGCVLVGEQIEVNKCLILNSKLALKKIEAEFTKFQSDLCIDCDNTNKYPIEVIIK